MEISRARRVTKLWPDALAFRHSDHEQGSLVVQCVVLVPSSARTATSPSSRPVGAARSQGSAGSWTACGWGGGGRVASSVVARRPRKRLPTGQGGAIVMRPATSAGPAGPIALPPARRVQSASRSPDQSKSCRSPGLANLLTVSSAARHAPDPVLLPGSASARSAINQHRTSIPSYRLHEASGGAFVTLDGRDHNLGLHKSAGPGPVRTCRRRCGRWSNSSPSPARVVVRWFCCAAATSSARNRSFVLLLAEHVGDDHDP